MSFVELCIYNLYIVYSIVLHCVLCIVYCVLCTVYCVLCIVYCILCTAYCVLHIVYCVLCTVYQHTACIRQPHAIVHVKPSLSCIVSAQSHRSVYADKNTIVGGKWEGKRRRPSLFLPNFYHCNICSNLRHLAVA